jgi:hypothetical protein
MCISTGPEVELILGGGALITLPPAIAASFALWRPTRGARIAALALALPGALLGLWFLRGGVTYIGTLGAFLLVACVLSTVALARDERAWRIAAAVMTAPPVLIVAYYAVQALLVTPKC